MQIFSMAWSGDLSESQGYNADVPEESEELKFHMEKGLITFYCQILNYTHQPANMDLKFFILCCQILNLLCWFRLLFNLKSSFADGVLDLSGYF